MKSVFCGELTVYFGDRCRFVGEMTDFTLWGVAAAF
jgi:hypothetical protein